VKAVLLDTNAFAMALTADPRLPAAAIEIISEAERVAVSAISLYEIGQKVRLGKWPEMQPHVGGLEAQARTDGYDLVPLSAEAALDAATMDWSHRDPFDRMIAAVARLEDLLVVSSDTAFDDLPIRRSWA
jgi:PIN domain nuclease of toxin-antitoxin system